MGENNKILDVTYGNFSCRLEGFEDSVETMKSVVGYFHDLAGHALFTQEVPFVPDIDAVSRLAAEQTDGDIAIESDEHGISLRVMTEVEDAAPDTMPEDGEGAEETFADDFEAEDLPVAQTAAPDDSDDSAADRLERIRAVVGRGGPPPREDSYAEDLSENEGGEAPKALNPLAQRLAELAKRNSELMEADALEEAPAIARSTPLTLDQEELDDEDEADAYAAEHEISAFEESDDDAEYMEDDFDDDDEEDEFEEADAAALDSGDVPASDDDAEYAEDDYDDDYDDDDAELSEPEDAPLLLTTPYEPEAADDDNDDDDFDLGAEVAKIEREIAARPGNEVARHGLPRSVEDAMSRIMSKTDQELDLQETRDGRDAIAQLKAAVAATEAARQLGDAGAKSRDVSAQFRDDLGALEGTERPSGKALPTLRLVEPVAKPNSTLREVAPLAEAASRLREIAATTKVKSTETKPLTFAEFAEQQGASDLVDKLEAAAAYLAFVEGESDFSRPQVMKVVQSATEAEVTREDGLRSFGRLLRQSRIIKLNNGRFQIAESTRFRPDENQAARH